MRDELVGRAIAPESLILNMDDSSGKGTHWTCLLISSNSSYYFDSFGLPPPTEVVNYCPNMNRFYSSFKIQKPEEVICGQYCIYMLYKLSQDIPTVEGFYKVLQELSVL